jgi:hypothetical protein
VSDTAVTGLSGFGALDADQLGRLVDQLPVLLWSTDRELRVTSRHGGGLARLGPVAQRAQGLRVGQVAEDPAESARAIAAHRAALAGEATVYEITLRGRTFSARVEPLRDPGGAISGVVGVAFDVTDRRRAEDALRESETRLRTIIESEPECVKLIDHKGLLLHMNPAGLAMIEADGLEAVQGLPILDVVAPEHRAAFTALHERVFQGHSGTLEFEIIGLKGRRRWMATHTVPLRDASGAIQAALGITRDITDARRAEEQIRASRTALRSLAARQQDVREDERTRIAREIHDTLGQALTALKLQLSAAQEAAKDAPALKARLHETTLMVDDLVKSVRRIASDLRPPILDQLGLPAAVEWLAQDFTRRTGIRCEAAILPTDGAISDELATSLFRIVQEALTNVLRHAGATRVDIELGIKGGCVTLEINDDGSGITEAGTMGPGSLGILGMRERAAALGGVLEVAPRAGGGTRVAAWFPPPVGGARDRKAR